MILFCDSQKEKPFTIPISNWKNNSNCWNGNRCMIYSNQDQGQNNFHPYESPSSTNSNAANFLSKRQPCEKYEFFENKNIWFDQFKSFINAILNRQSSYILRRPQNVAKSSPYFWLQYIKSKIRGRFCKILLPSQNI